MEYSISPEGERFPLPDEAAYRAEFERLQTLVKENREAGREIVVVMGLGFVGAVMAGVVADSVNKETGSPNKFVIGMQRPSPRSFWKIPLLNRGVSPVKAEDPEVAQRDQAEQVVPVEDREEEPLGVGLPSQGE